MGECQGLFRIYIGYTLEENWKESRIMKKSIERRKPQKERKESAILIRVSAEQKAILQAASKKAGLDLSSWLRSTGLREAGN